MIGGQRLKMTANATVGRSDLTMASNERSKRREIDKKGTEWEGTEGVKGGGPAMDTEMEMECD